MNLRLNGHDQLPTVMFNILIAPIIPSHSSAEASVDIPHADHKVYFGIVSILVELATLFALAGIALVVSRLVADGDEPTWGSLQALTFFQCIFNIVA